LITGENRKSQHNLFLQLWHSDKKYLGRCQRQLWMYRGQRSYLYMPLYERDHLSSPFRLVVTSESIQFRSTQQAAQRRSAGHPYSSHCHWWGQYWRPRSVPGIISQTRALESRH
jgi:hypothetical protein